MFKNIIALLGLVHDFSDAKICYGKRWFTSKTLWINAIALLGGILQWKFGMVLPVEAQAGILAILNMLLRFDTNQSVVMKKSDIVCNATETPMGTVYAPVIKSDPTGISPNETL